jgi:hypothetical protein
MSRVTDHLPDKLFDYLRAGAPILLLTIGEDGFPNVAFTWAIAPDAHRVRFGADHGSVTLANLQREGRAALQIIGPTNLLFLVKGSARLIKERIAAAPFRIALMESALTEVKDQSFPGVNVAPLGYEWYADRREAMLAMEQAVYAEMHAGGSA